MNTTLQLLIKKNKESKGGKVVAPLSGEKSKTKPDEPNTSKDSNDAPRSTSLEGLLGFELPFEALYCLEEKLRSGSFATVHVTKHRLTDELFATKVIDRR